VKNILVIKLGALGDIFASTSAFEAIRNHHKGDHLTFLTTKLYINMANELGCFDEIWLDKRPSFTQFKELWNLRTLLRSKTFDRVYDLQMVDRTNFYYHLMGRPEWVGTARGASHRYQLPSTPTYHQDRLKGLLTIAGINTLPPLDLTRLAKNIQDFPVRKPYVLFAPGASKAHRHTKCWPLERYGEIAQSLAKEGLTPVIVGGPDEDNSILTKQCPQAIDLTGKTQLMDILTLATHAAFAIGNDTGPMHIAATCRCPVLVLFFGAHDPKAVGPRGEFYRHIKETDKMDLKTSTVMQYLPEFVNNFKNRTLFPH